MTEYRIVGTKTMEHKNGKVDVVKNIHPAVSGYGSYNVKYQDLETAERDLESAKIDLAFWTKCHNRNAEKDEKYGVIIHWTNLHLESREVSEWEEV